SQSDSGFVIYLPVYRPGAPTGTVEERRAALHGFIFASFDAEKMLAGVFGRTNSVVGGQIYDGTEMVPEKLLYKQEAESGKVTSGVARPSRVMTMPVLDRVWTIQFSTLPAFEAGSQANRPLLVLGCSLGLSLLFFGITWMQVSARARAEKISADLQKSEAALA